MEMTEKGENTTTCVYTQER